jgi:hypothetical protein
VVTSGQLFVFRTAVEVLAAKACPVAAASVVAVAVAAVAAVEGGRHANI